MKPIAMVKSVATPTATPITSLFAVNHRSQAIPLYLTVAAIRPLNGAFRQLA